ncbi:MBL fold metallo-hydrolase [Pannus brasiliensis CCIBt3594]|uniref:MBL fold metallo-hydrolase n=1 Tax=Pannus brasiliensis CCIBt3594 TaxID=1427578 RepID=A0AAW9QM70_9CHRO
MKRFLITFFCTLSIVALGLFGWQYSATSQALTLESAGLTLQQVGSGVYTLIASTDFPAKDMKRIAICNAGIVIGKDGVLVIDPFQSEELGKLLLQTVKKITDKPVLYVLNTHYHFDHTGGNKAIADGTIPIIGRGPIREFMIEKNKDNDPNPNPPDLIVNGQSTIWLGDRKVIVESVEGHSGGTDVIASVPDANVLFSGDILFNQRIPYVSDGNIQQWQETLNRLIATYNTAKIVPGHGAVTDVNGLKSLQTYFNDLTRLALGWKEKGLSEEMAVKTSSEIPAAYKNYKFQAMYPLNLQTAYQQITLAK